VKDIEVRKAVVLAAGLGTRLRPLTDVVPKPLLPVWGEPMLERIVSMLESWGVEEIAVNAHHLAGQVRDWCAARKGKARLVVSEESEILGTGGVLNPLRPFLGDGPFWLVNGDIVVEDLDPRPIREAFVRSGGFAACWMTEAGPRTIEADPEGRICNWHSDDAGFPGTYTYCGLALLGREILDYVPPTGFSSIVEAYEKAMMTSARFVTGVSEDNAFWWDAGTPERLREVNDGPQPVALFRDPRLDALVAALGWTDVGADFLGARGSDRAFWRLDTADGRTAIAVEYDAAKRPENARYAAHARLLAEAGVPVPAVLADVPEKSVLALEEFAGPSLEDRANAAGADLVKLYTPVVKALAAFHTKGTERALAQDAKLEPAFDPALYRWERDLFETHCVKDRFALPGLPPAVAEELDGVARTLGECRPVLVHRDFQSSNVLYAKTGGKFAFIDFQGMRLGCAAYDLASLLYDPYVPLGERARAALAKVYAAAAPELADAVRLLPQAAVQRLVQALGAFGRLASVGQPRFERYIGRALGNLLAAADEADLDAIGGFAEDLISKEEIRHGHFPHHHHHDGDEDEER